MFLLPETRPHCCKMYSAAEKRRVLDGQSGGRVIAQEKLNELSGDPTSLGKSGTLSTVDIGVISVIDS